MKQVSIMPDSLPVTIEPDASLYIFMQKSHKTFLTFLVIYFGRCCNLLHLFINPTVFYRKPAHVSTNDKACITVQLNHTYESTSIWLLPTYYIHREYIITYQHIPG